MADPYIPFYTSDFLGGTSGMTAATRGVYITLLCLMYEAEAPLGQSWGSLARRCGASNSGFKKAVEDLVDEGKLSVGDDGIWSEKVEPHLSYRHEKRRKARKSAKVRWEKTQQKQQKNDANALRTECYPEPEPDKERHLSVSQEKPSEKPKPKVRRAVALPQGWVPSEKNLADARKRNFTDGEIDHEASQFRDHHHARGTTFKDWDAAWRTWLGNARKFGGRGMARQPSAIPGGQGGSIASIVARRRLAGEA